MMAVTRITAVFKPNLSYKKICKGQTTKATTKIFHQKYLDQSLIPISALGSFRILKDYNVIIYSSIQISKFKKGRKT